MDPILLTSYSGIALGVISGLAGLRLALRRPFALVSTLVTFSFSLLALFGGGYGLAGLTTVAQALHDLGVVMRAPTGTPEHRQGYSRVLQTLGNRQLTTEERDAIRTVLAAYPSEDNDELLTTALLQATTPEHKIEIEQLQTAIQDRRAAAVRQYEAASAPQGITWDAAFQSLTPEGQRALLSLPTNELMQHKIPRDRARTMLER